MNTKRLFLECLNKWIIQQEEVISQVEGGHYLEIIGYIPNPKLFPNILRLNHDTEKI